MIDKLLKELKDTWGYDTEELNDIREKMETFGYSCYNTGYLDREEEFVQYYYGFSYGKKSDNE